jgi:DNA helicase-2/ATP-dependent DNA helicase PcrA
MSAVRLFEMPGISNADVGWVCKLLSLPENAFEDQEATGGREDVLKCQSSFDLAACPGSGKTTLVVAKLAALARNWQYKGQGICALSHTNVARHEIETRLSATAVGRQLLCHPHYIGTIHGFVNEFLALPWLRSRGNPIKLIDTGVCQRRRWNKFPLNTRYYLERCHMTESDIRLSDTSCNFEKAKGTLPFGSETTTYSTVKKTLVKVSSEGYHCYDDMFIWANELLCKHPETLNVVRGRFPIVFIDEAQDNNDAQSKILSQLFPSDCVIRYRFGDSNQAIFDFMGANAATIDKFPQTGLLRTVSDSYRFGQAIADLADPLGVVPYGLRGRGPQRISCDDSAEARHTVFLFRDENIAKVLDNFCELIAQTFSDSQLASGTFTAVGQIHNRPMSTEAGKVPQHVGDYWNRYDPELSSRDARPSTFASYIAEAQRQSNSSSEACGAVEKLASAIVRLTQLSESGPRVIPLNTQHRQILHRLDAQREMRKEYLDLVHRFAISRTVLTSALWNSEVRPALLQIAEALIGEPVRGTLAEDFLEWHEDVSSSAVIQASRDNIYVYSRDGKDVRVRAGSIHSVKGETHLATLVWRLIGISITLLLCCRGCVAISMGHKASRSSSRFG